MKKLLGLGLLVLCAATLTSLTNPVINHRDNDLQTSTIDFANEKQGIKKESVKSITSKGKFNATKIYAQTAIDDEGYEYLRFATALRGNFDKITYTRHIEGLEDKEEEVTTLYKGISANNVTSYTNGSDLVNYDVTSTKEYYWACYTIKFNKESIYKNTNITITLNVDDYVDTRTTSLTSLKNNINGELSLQDQISNGNIDISKYDLNVITNSQTYNTYYYIQGMTTDGNNIYFSVTNNKGLIIRKYNPTIKEIVDVSGDLTMDTTSSSDGNHIKYINNKIYVIANNGKIKVYDLSNKTFNEVTFTDSIGTIKDLGYNKTTNQFITLNTEGLVQLYNDDLKAISSFKVDTSHSKHAIKAIQNDDKYIYVTYMANGFRGINVNVYNYSGNKVNTFDIQNNEFMKSAESGSFNCPNVVFSNNKMYVCGITWTGTVHGEIYELDFNAKISNLTESKIKWDEYEGYASIYNKTATIKYDLISSRFNISGYNYVHGVVNDINNPRYAYFSMNSVSNLHGIIAKYDFETNQIIGYSKEYTSYKTEDNTNNQYSYADNANLFMYGDKIYALDSYGKFMSVNASEITGNSTAEVTQNDTTLSFDVTDKIKSVVYSKKEDKFAVNAGNKLFIFDGELNKTKEIASTTFQTLYSDGNYIYGFSKTEASKVTNEETTTYKYYDTATITKYDFDGNKLLSKKYGDENTPIGPAYEKTGNRCTNLQNMIIVNGDLYFTRVVHTASEEAGQAGGYLFKLSVNEEAELNKKITNKTYGEYLESASQKYLDIVEHDKNKKINDFGYLQDGVTIGDYVYYSYTNGSNSKMYINKVNPLTGESTYSSSTIDLGKPEGSKDVSDLGKLFAYDGKLWVVEFNSKKVKAIDLDTLLETGEEKEFSSLPEGTIIKDVVYNEFTDSFAVLSYIGSTYNIYYIDSNGEITNTTNVDSANGPIKSMNGNNDYLYVAYSKDNQQGIGISVYDYSGNFITKYGIADSIVQKTNFNTQAITEYKGMIILIGLGWGDNAGGFTYYVNLK